MSPAIEPVVRAAVVKLSLGQARLLPTSESQHILALIPAVAQDAIAEASALEWLPLALQMAVAEPFRKTLGDEGYQDAVIEGSRAMTKLPLFRAATEAAVRLMGASPAGVLKWFSQAWDLAYRGCGTVTYAHEEPAMASLVLDDFPRAEFASLTFAHGLLGTLRYVSSLSRIKGTASMMAPEPARGRVVYRVTWPAGSTSVSADR